MKPFLTYKTECIKCGGAKHTLKYWNGRFPAADYFGLFPAKDARGEYDKMKSTAPERECIKVTCSVCGYQWSVKPADKSYENL